MTGIALKLQPRAPLEGAVINPDVFEGKSASQIASLPVTHGNERAELGDFFAVRGDGTPEIVLEGDLGRVKSIGAGMTHGTVTVHGNAGMHLGAQMMGGEISVSGNVDDWAGAEMAGGKIHVRGDAGHGLGGAYRGSRRGMNRGLIIVEGNAGNEAGAVMRRGLIVVSGDAGDFTGAFMIAGSIVVMGKLGIRAGAGMLRGSIIAFTPPEILPTFRYACRYSPGFLALLSGTLQGEGINLPKRFCGNFLRYSGDFNRLGKGEILVHDEH
jgi:formylmethanofuran dehydrogenase subunit C